MHSKYMASSYINTKQLVKNVNLSVDKKTQKYRTFFQHKVGF